MDFSVDSYRDSYKDFIMDYDADCTCGSIKESVADSDCIGLSSVMSRSSKRRALMSASDGNVGLGLQIHHISMNILQVFL